MKEFSIEECDKYLTDNYPVHINYFDKYLNKSLLSAYLKLMKVYFLIKEGNIDLAKEEYSLINIDSPVYNSHGDLYYMIKGIFLFLDKNRKDALNYFQIALSKEKSRNKWLRIELFYFYFEIENYTAFGYLDEAIDIDPNFYEAIIQKCYYMDSEHNCEEIITNLEKLPITYEINTTLNLLGVAYTNCGNIDKGIKIIKKSIENEPTSENNYLLGYIYSNFLKRLDLAEGFFLKSLSFEKANIDTINSYAWLLYEKNDMQLAEKKFKELLSINKDQTAYDQIIQFYLLTKKISKAEKFISESINQNGFNFTNEGFEIILLLIMKKNHKAKLDAYKIKYGEFEVDWLHGMINDLRVA